MKTVFLGYPAGSAVHKLTRLASSLLCIAQPCNKGARRKKEKGRNTCRRLLPPFPLRCTSPASRQPLAFSNSTANTLPYLQPSSNIIIKPAMRCIIFLFDSLGNAVSSARKGKLHGVNKQFSVPAPAEQYVDSSQVSVNGASVMQRCHGSCHLSSSSHHMQLVNFATNTAAGAKEQPATVYGILHIRKKATHSLTL